MKQIETFNSYPFIISCISSSKKFSNCVKQSIRLLRSVPSKYELVISFLFTISKSSLNFLQYLSGLFIFISLPLCLYYTIFFTNSQVILLSYLKYNYFHSSPILLDLILGVYMLSFLEFLY